MQSRLIVSAEAARQTQHRRDGDPVGMEVPDEAAAMIQEGALLDYCKSNVRQGMRARDLVAGI